MIFETIIGVIAIVCAVWVIYDVLTNNRKLSEGMKVFWIIFAIIFSIITAITYYFLGRENQHDLFNRRKGRKK